MLRQATSIRRKGEDMVMVKKSKMKKSAIKKWEQSYTAPIPYFGLMELNRDSFRSISPTSDTNCTYWGNIEKVFEGIPIVVSVGIFGEIEYFDISNNSSIYEDGISDEEYRTRRDLGNENKGGASVATYSGKVVIRDSSIDSDYSASYYNYIVGTGRDYRGPEFGNFMSIEDAIARVGEIVEEFFPKVMEYVNQEKMASTRKSKKAKKMAKNSKMKKSVKFQCEVDSEPDIDIYDENGEYIKTVSGIDITGFDEYDRLNEAISEYVTQYPQDYDLQPVKYASTKKSRMAKLNKKLGKLGGFTKEDEDEEDDDKIEIEIESDGKDVEVESDNEDEIIDEEEDMVEESCKGCKSEKTRKAFRTSKKVRKDQLDYDADEQQDINEKGSGSAGSELPEDADENQDINEKGSGSAGDELPEDADEQQNIKESTRKARIARMKEVRAKSVNKSINRPAVRKFSVTNGGSPDQTSYNQRYQQSPMVRNAIDGRSDVEKFDEVAMLQQRLNAMNKSKRNARNNVPQRLR